MNTRRKFLSFIPVGIPLLWTGSSLIKLITPALPVIELPSILDKHILTFKREITRNFQQQNINAKYLEQFIIPIEIVEDHVEGDDYKFMFRNKMGNEIWLINDGAGQRTITK